MKAILQTMQGGGSGYGISFWKSWMGCEARAWFLEELAMLRKKSGKPLSMGQVKKALVLGTVTHSFFELYYRLAMKGKARRALQLDTTAVSFVDDAGDPADVAEDARLEAERLFRAYRTVYPPDELGEVIEVEKLYEGKDIETAVECSPFTFKPDLAVYLDSFAPRRLRKTRRIKVEKGYYLVDHKTATETGWTDEMFMREVQFTAYQLAWQWRYPRRELKGLLVNIVPKTARPEFRTLVVPYPSEHSQKVLKNFLSQAQDRRERALRYRIARANITHCYPWGQTPCEFLGKCDRGA